MKHNVLFGLTHIFEAWNTKEVVFTLVVNVNPLLTTFEPIIRVGNNPTRNHSSTLFYTWWKLPDQLPSEIEDHILYEETTYCFGLVKFLTALNDFFDINSQALSNLEQQLPPITPPSYSCLPYVAFPPPPDPFPLPIQEDVTNPPEEHQ